MKKLFWLMLIATSANATASLDNISQTRSHQTQDCLGETQYFTLQTNTMNDTKIAFVSSTNFHVESTLPPLTFITNTTYSNQFMARTNSIYTGVIHALTATGSQALCGMTFTCRVTDREYLHSDVILNGEKCSFSDGDGSKQHPYVIQVG